MTTCPRCHLTWGRSDEEHNLFFGVIGMAFDNWPEAHVFKPHSAEHLRGWLLIEAQHFDTLTLAHDTTPSHAVAIGAFFTEGKTHFDVTHDKFGRPIIRRPKTIKKGECKIREFRIVAAKVYDIIAVETGLTPEIYKKEQGKAA